MSKVKENLKLESKVQDFSTLNFGLLTYAERRKTGWRSKIIEAQVAGGKI